MYSVGFFTNDAKSDKRCNCKMTLLNVSTHRSSLLQNYYQKFLEIEIKKIVREVVRGDRHHLRKSAARKAKHKSVRRWFKLSGLICALRSAYFLRLCLSLRATTRTISFSISNTVVFGVNLNHFFDGKNNLGWGRHFFDFLPWALDHSSRHLTNSELRVRFFWQRKWWTRCKFQCHNGDHLEREKRKVVRKKRKVRIIGKGKC